MSSSSSSSSSPSPSSSSSSSLKKKEKQGLGWMESLRGWFNEIYEMLFQRITASHLQNPLPLPLLNDITCIVTGYTSGIGLNIARQLAESGAHVVMAVRRPKLANELIQKWQNEWSRMGLPLNIEVMELDLLSLDSVVKFAEAWNARLGPLHVLINNAGMFAMGGHSDPAKLKETAQNVQQLSASELKKRQLEIRELMEKSKMPSDAELMKIAITDLNNSSLSLEEHHRALQELLILVDLIDNANVVSNGSSLGFPPQLD